MNTPWRITIDTNPDLCNLHCIMCDTHSIYNTDRKNTRPVMRQALLEKVLIQAKQAKVREIIPSTMGEPLLYPSFDLFIEQLSDSNIKLNLTTNGTFPQYGTETWGRKLLPVTCDTKISLNGISPAINESIMIKSDTGKALENIKTYLKMRDIVRKTGKTKPTVTLQVTFMRRNLKEIKNIIEFAIKYHVDRVKGHYLWVNWHKLENENLRKAKNVELWNRFIDSINSYRKHIKLENFDPIDQNGDETVPEFYECPFINKELWIDNVGNYNVCCAPSDKRKTLGNFGSINDTDIGDVFNSPNYKELQSNYKNKPVCRNCLLRKPL